MGGSSRVRCLVGLDACRLHGSNVSLNRMHRLVGPAGKLPIIRLCRHHEQFVRKARDTPRMLLFDSSRSDFRRVFVYLDRSFGA
jgi:hypothetical protein